MNEKTQPKLRLLSVKMFFAILPFWVSFAKVEEDGKLFFYKPVIEYWKHIALEKSFFVFVGLLLFFIWSDRFTKAINKNERILAAVLSGFFAAFVHMGYSVNNADASLDLIFGSLSLFVVSAAVIFGHAVLFYPGLCLCIYFAENYGQIIDGSAKLKHFGTKVDGFLSKKTFLKFWAGLIICWLPYLIINYPATVHGDSGRMISHYLNNNLDNHDPIMQTLFWGKFYTFFRDLTGSGNVAAFLFSAFQSLYCSAVFAAFYTHLYKTRKTPSQILVPVYFITAVMPMFTRNSATICKDSNFSIYVLLFVLIMFLYDRCKAKDVKKVLPLMFIDLLLVMFARKNGVHLLVISSVVFLAYLIFTGREVKSFALLLTFCTAIFTHAAVENVVTIKYDLQDNDTRESSSVFFQQTARYVRDHSDVITQEEKEAIDKVLDYNAIGAAYDAKRSDPVKDTYRKEATKEDFNNYLKAWAKGLFKEPGCYIQATIGNISGYFYPDDFGYYSDLYFISQPFTDEIKTPESLKPLAETLRMMDCDSHHIPVVGLFSSVGFYIWADIFMTLFFLYKKRYSLFVYNVPALVTMLIFMASPINNTVRYALPAIFMVPFIFCAYFGEDCKPSKAK